MSTALLMLVLHGLSNTTADVVVVCPQPFRAALEPWVEYRARQGHEIAFVSNLLSVPEIRDQIRKEAAGGRVRFVVLVGDADPAMQRDPAVRARCVPTQLQDAKVIARWGPDSRIASDNYYADLDNDGVPDAAVGRLTADSPRELRNIVNKILAYERSVDFGAWRRRINVVAGVGGFGAVADTAIELTAKRLLAEGIPAAYSTTMTYSSWRSPYCPDPAAFRQVTLDRLNEGCLFWVYLGHGEPRCLDRLPMFGNATPVLADFDMPRLVCRHGAPIACLFCCYSGAFDQPSDCLAEEMLRSPGAPVAVLCGSRVTMPYAMAVLGTGLLDQYFAARPATLGEALVAAKRSLIAAERHSVQRAAIDMLATLLSPAPAELAAERAEHADLFNLIGDPLLRLRYPREVKLEVARAIEPGKSLTIVGDSPIEGICTAELVVRRDRLTFHPPLRHDFDASPTARASFSDVYARANDPRLSQVQVRAGGGRFTTELEVPATAEGDCHVRVWIEGADDFAAGATDVRVQPVVQDERTAERIGNAGR